MPPFYIVVFSLVWLILAPTPLGESAHLSQIAHSEILR